jgi:hypothetical protein
MLRPHPASVPKATHPMSDIAAKLRAFRVLARELMLAEIEQQAEADHTPFHDAIEIGRAALVAEIDEAYEQILTEAELD